MQNYFVTRKYCFYCMLGIVYLKKLNRIMFQKWYKCASLIIIFIRMHIFIIFDICIFVCMYVYICGCIHIYIFFLIFLQSILLLCFIIFFFLFGLSFCVSLMLILLCYMLFFTSRLSTFMLLYRIHFQPAPTSLG